MPHSSNYTPIWPLISSARIESYRGVFQTVNDADLYGVYIWAQRALKRILRSLTSHVHQRNITAAWSYAGAVYGLFRIR